MVSFTVGANSARRSWHLLLKVGAKFSWLANTIVAPSITINVVTRTINVATTIATSINKRSCQHADDKSLIQWCGMKDAILHLQLPIVYLIWGFLRRWLEAATGCWRGLQYDGKCFFYLNCYFFRTSPTNRDLREKAVYFPPRICTSTIAYL